MYQQQAKITTEYSRECMSLASMYIKIISSFVDALQVNGVLPYKICQCFYDGPQKVQSATQSKTKLKCYQPHLWVTAFTCPAVQWEIIWLHLKVQIINNNLLLN